MNWSPKDKADIFLKSMALIIGAFGIFEFYLSNQIEVAQKKSERSIAYINQFSGKALSQYQIILTNFWIENTALVKELENPDFSSDNYANLLRSLVYNNSNRSELFSSVFQYLLFYEEVYACIQGDLCDQDILHHAFCHRASGFDKLYTPLISDLAERIGNKGVTSGLEGILEGCSVLT